MRAHFAVGILCCLLLVSCKTMKGDLDVHEDIVLYKKKSIFSSKLEKVKIAPGKYSTKIKPKKKGIKVKMAGVGDDNVLFNFKLPEDVKLPSYEGELVIKKEKTDQPYDLVINVSTDQSSYSYDTTRSCISHYEYETVCSWIPSRESCQQVGGGQVCRTKPSGDEVCYDRPSRRVCRTIPGHRSCREERRAVYGHQSVEVTKVTTTKNVIVNLKDDQTIMATFDHSDSDTTSHSSARGACHY